jgi:D-erythro-7,8-dihydroneopterin triphosphate epimerase
MAIIRIKNLMISTFIGFNPEELVNKQNVVINLEIEVNVPAEALAADEPIGIYDYKTVTKQVITLVQDGNFKLLEVLTKRTLDLIMLDKRVLRAKVEVDKPQALRFADSVSFEMTAAQ